MREDSSRMREDTHSNKEAVAGASYERHNDYDKDRHDYDNQHNH